jgi:hypothetical protein
VEPRLGVRRRLDARGRRHDRPHRGRHPSTVADDRDLRLRDRSCAPVHLRPRRSEARAALRRLAGRRERALHAPRPRRRRRPHRPAAGRAGHGRRRPLLRGARRPARHDERRLVAQRGRRRLHLRGGAPGWSNLRPAWPGPAVRRRRLMRRPPDGGPAERRGRQRPRVGQPLRGPAAARRDYF